MLIYVFEQAAVLGELETTLQDSVRIEALDGMERIRGRASRGRGPAAKKSRAGCLANGLEEPEYGQNICVGRRKCTIVESKEWLNVRGLACVRWVQTEEDEQKIRYRVVDSGILAAQEVKLRVLHNALKELVDHEGLREMNKGSTVNDLSMLVQFASRYVANGGGT